MLKMLIVEDERWEREGLVDFLDWAALGIEVAGLAADGFEGLEQAEKLEPDIIVTDIQMPGKNGLEMSREVRRILPHVRIVVLTGYNDFSYAKEAIQNQVDDYILKPVEEEEMRETMVKVAEKCLADRARLLALQESEHLLQEMATVSQIAAEKLWQDLLAERRSAEEVRMALGERGMLPPSERLTAVVLVPPEEVRHADWPERLPPGSVVVDSETVERSLALVIPVADGEDGEDGGEWLAERIAELSLSCRPAPIIGISRAGSGLVELPAVYQEAAIAAEYARFLDIPGVTAYEEADAAKRRFSQQAPAFLNAWQDSARQLRKALLLGKPDSMRGQEQAMAALLRAHPGAGKDYVAALISGMLGELAVLDGTRDREGSGGDLRRLFGMFRLADMLDFTAGYLEDLNARLGAKRNHKDEFIAERVVSLIEEYYNSDRISMTMLADQVFLSPNHLGMIFKKVMGKTINTYLTETRMNKAEEMLRTTTKKVSEIANEVGVFNFSYFCALFKQAFGVTPGEYQEMAHRR